MQNPKLYRIIVSLCISMISLYATAGDGGGIVARSVLDGAKNQVKKDSSRTVEDSAFFNPANIGALDTGYSVQNVVTLKINEASPVYLRSAFSATVQLRIIYSNGSTIDSIDRNFTVNYDSAHTYNARNSFVFAGGRRVTVKVLSVDSSVTGWNVSSVLQVENQLTANPKFLMACNNTVANITAQPSVDPTADELPVTWTAVRGADQYDVEWTYIDASALTSGRYGSPVDAAKVFFNNATRISTTATSYNIPLIYDNNGTLFVRVRPVQIGRAKSVTAAIWSTEATPAVLGQYVFSGHERKLNWQSNISFAEEGKRKVVLQYFDGSLRSRQTVTKDNTTNNTIVAETYYDYQGRPAIQVMPAPSFRNIVKYAANFNIGINTPEYSQSNFDTLLSADLYCNAAAQEMSADSGASRYYSPNNPNKAIGMNQFIPDAKNFPFTETEYTQDATGRISRQGGVGPDHQLGSGHETKYYYGTPDQKELDALFGTNVGDKSHYFKNMVRDANGQYSVSYVDMHGRTIATALAGSTPLKMAPLASNIPSVITENLADSGSRFLQDWNMINQKSIVVPVADTFKFSYKLDPASLLEKNCDQQDICYTCLYDLQITITDNCNNQLLPGGMAFDTVVHNFAFGAISGTCSDEPMNLNFDLYLQEGSYQITKKLTVNREAYVYYRDSIYLPNNTCMAMTDFIKEQRDLIASQTSNCAPDCGTCRDSVGTYAEYSARLKARTGLTDADSLQIKTAYNNAVAACNTLCGDSSSIDNDIRAAMLQDMTPPYGQYADTADSKLNSDKFSIFYLDPKTEESYVPVFKLDAIQYTDPTGRPDSVYVVESDLFVEPGMLSMSQFVQNFRTSWAESLLPYHPEYCKLKTLESLRTSNLWDRRMESIDNYQDAVAGGYLNPLDMNSVPYPSVYNNRDPFFAGNLAYRGAMNALMKKYINKAGSGSNGIPDISMWAMACIMAKCESNDKSCIKHYADTAANNFNTATMCEGDLDMAWRYFRQLYLGRKQELTKDYIRKSTGCKPANPAYNSAVPDNGTLLTYGHQPQFVDDPASIINNNDTLKLAYQANNKPGKEGVAVAQTQSQMQGFYEQNVNALVQQWASQLSPCAYTQTALRDTIMPWLRGLCMLATDREHPFGARTLPAGITYTPQNTSYVFKSFEDIINKYNEINNITNSVDCNAELITTPQPYDQQPAYSNKPVYTKPADCECKLINDYYNVYRLTRLDASFAAYLERTQGITMSNTALNRLRSLCNNPASAGTGGPACVWLPQPILLPPSLQCNTGQVCVSCTLIDTMYQKYRQQFPADTPRLAEAQDTMQLKKNQLFKNFMNNRLGFSLETYEYLAFMEQCAASKDTISNHTECTDQAIGNIYQYNLGGKLEDIQKTNDKGYIMVGATGSTVRDGGIIKSDSSGNVQWALKYGGAGDDQLVRVRQTSDNGYIAIGTTKSGRYPTGAIWVLKLTPAGTVNWAKTIGFSTPFGDKGYDIVQTSDGGYAALGIFNQHAGHGEFILSRLDADGALTWTKRFGSVRIQRNDFLCSVPEQDTVVYDGIPNYSLVQKEDTLLVAGAAYDRNMGNRYYGVVYRFDAWTGGMLGSWHYADNSSATKSSVFRDIYAVNDGYMVTVTSAEKLGTDNQQIGVLHLSDNGEVQTFKRFNLPAGSSKTSSSAAYPATDGGYIVAQTGNSGTHINWQRIDAAGSLLWSTETALPGTQRIGRLIQNSDNSFTGAGVNNDQMLVIDLRADGSCYDNTTNLGVTNGTMSRVNWATMVDQVMSPTHTDTTMSPIALTVTNTAINCEGDGSCYNIYNGPLLCGKSQPIFAELPSDSTGICSDSTFFAVSKGTELYKVYSDSLTGNFEQRYVNNCLQAYKYESFTVTHPHREYHYTLYYYDQAGNLVRTVPPAGVQANFDTTWLKQVVAARIGREELLPAHTMTTDYRYNSLNQVVAQWSPDGGTSHFWYDRLGRLSVSQNAQQKLDAKYSYTSYDTIGRIVEVGQLTSATAITDAISRNQANLRQWLVNAAPSGEQITKTFYDFGYAPLQPIMSARNTRNRVGWSALYNTAADLNDEAAATATYYSYDVLGNVDTLVQDYRFGVMAEHGNRFKKVVYDYDLVSGKVNQVSYQPGQPDAFYHKYLYDAENRITHVQTSADSINWDNDAFYQYYDHGPLARAIIGEQQVQGVNYAYTMQGWLKAINPDVYNGSGYNLKADGTTGSIVGKSAYNVMLNYFNGDYNAISPATALDAGIATALGDQYRPLYNGNISSMAVNIAALNNPLLYNYQYDQLNRLVKMDAWQKNGSSWGNILEKPDYQERISYDPNGNILGYKRNGTTAGSKPLGMDSLTYKYAMGTNKLDHVRDSVPVGNYTEDIDQQTAGNYTYDSIGNMIADNAEGISSIAWTVYGKISHIAKTNGTNIHYTYDAAGNRISKSVIVGTDTTITWYARDAQGNTMSVYQAGIDSVNNGHLTQTEQHLYGSSRLGLLRRSIDVAILPLANDTAMPLLGKGYKFNFERGHKIFELSNHLGNVLVTVSDKKFGYSAGNDLVDHYEPDVVSAQDYYPFGMLMVGREYNAGGYRFGFNGKENDNEVKGLGNIQDYGMRINDTRLGRFLSIDPLSKSYPWYTPYQFAGNKPIFAIDLDGEEEKIVINKFESGKQVVSKTLTKKDAQFNAVLKGVPKELKGLVPGEGALVIDQYRSSGFMHVGDPDYNDYRYYGRNDVLTPISTLTTYNNSAYAWMMQSPYSPQNITLENLGVKSAGAFIEISASGKAELKGFQGGGVYASSSVEGKVTQTFQVLSNGSGTDILNRNTAFSLETTPVAVGIKADPAGLYSKTKLEGFAGFVFSTKKDPAPKEGVTDETQYSFKLFNFKATFSISSAGDKTLKLGITSDRGIEYKQSNKEKATASSSTSQTDYHY